MQDLYSSDGTVGPTLTNAIYNALGKNTAQQNQQFEAQQAALNRDFQAQQAALVRDFNSAEAVKQRDFEREMSNTAYQRAVDDMKAAGLNTALMYSHSNSGASTPSGSAASAGGTPGGSAAHARGGDSIGLLGGIIGAITSVAKAAISANSASKLAKLATVTDYQDFGHGRKRTTTWRE